jgi:hypothetical protein
MIDFGGIALFKVNWYARTITRKLTGDRAPVGHNRLFQLGAGLTASIGESP